MNQSSNPARGSAASVDQLFFEALSITEGTAREAFLDRACGDAHELRQRLQRLLKASAQTGDFLEQPAQTPSDWRRGDSSQSLFSPPPFIGPYQLLEKIGEGGMGVIYRAQQHEPVQRQVALKLIRPGLDSESFIARFEAERQTLALMEHPHIARILDAGTFGSAPLERPYFVMELVAGLPITEYCDQHRLTLRERLKLMAMVCQAVHHAHQKGIIHRDLKPSNILVTQIDQAAVPKIIDFGIAKAIGPRLAHGSTLTGHGAVIGTMDYMSPEQAKLNPLALDTRADIFSLGAILHELLVGAPPFQRESFPDAGFLELLQQIQMLEPAAASTRLLTAPQADEIAKRRATDCKRLASAIRGELDWIVLKATARERKRRYETAHDLGLDLERHLQGNPVSAAPPSWTYRTTKFVRRYFWQSAAATAILTALLLAIAGTSWGLWRALQAEALATQNLVKANAAEAEATRRADSERRALNALRSESEQKDAALAEEARQRRFAQAITEFVQYDVLALTTLEGRDRFGTGDLPHDANLREVLLRAAARIGQRTDLDPEVSAELHWIVGVSLRAMGEPERAAEILAQSVEIYRKALGPSAELTLNAQNSLGVALRQAGRFREAIETLKVAQQGMVKVYGADHPFSLITARHLATSLLENGDLRESLDLHQSLLESLLQHFGEEYQETFLVRQGLASTQFQMGQLSDSLANSEALFQTIEQRDNVSDQTRQTVSTQLARTLVSFGELSRARQILQPIVQATRQRLGEQHPTTLYVLSLWASAQDPSQASGERIALLESIWKTSHNTLGAKHIETLLAQNNLGLGLQDIGQLDRALEHFKVASDGLIAGVGADHPYSLLVTQNLALAHYDKGNLDTALELLADAVARCESRLGTSHPTTLTLWNGYGVALRSSGRSYDAIQYLSRANDNQRLQLGPAHPDTVTSTINLAVTCRDLGELDRAIELYQSAIAATDERAEVFFDLRLKAFNNLAVVFWKQGRLSESIPLFESVLAALSQRSGDPTLTLTRCHALANLGRNYYDAGRLADAKPLLVEAWQMGENIEEFRWIKNLLLAVARGTGDQALVDELERQ